MLGWVLLTRLQRPDPPSSLVSSGSLSALGLVNRMTFTRLSHHLRTRCPGRQVGTLRAILLPSVGLGGTDEPRRSFPGRALSAFLRISPEMTESVRLADLACSMCSAVSPATRGHIPGMLDRGLRCWWCPSWGSLLGVLNGFSRVLGK